MPNLTEIDEEETSERPLPIRNDLMSFSPVFTTSECNCKLKMAIVWLVATF